MMSRSSSINNSKPFRSAAPTAASAAMRSSALDGGGGGGLVLVAGSEGAAYANFAPRDGGGSSSSSTYYGSNSSSNSNGGGGPRQHDRFSPYDANGGTVAAVAGPDYCVVAADTRLSSGYEILSRDASKLHVLRGSRTASGTSTSGTAPTAAANAGTTGVTVLASSGCRTDVDQLRSRLDVNMKVRGWMCVCVSL